MSKIYTVLNEEISRYSFFAHPFNNLRYFAFKKALIERGLLARLEEIKIHKATEEELLLFHSQEYINFVKEKEKEGGYLDYGDTPVFEGIFEASKIIVGATLSCIDKIMEENTVAFSPVGGLHHAYKDKASGFCVFNDIAVGINYLRKKYGLKKILYFDIDAHHGDGVYYSFIDDPYVYIVDFHQRGIFPGTGNYNENGRGKAIGTKLNIPLDYAAEDSDFFREFSKVEGFLEDKDFEFIIFQAGCDCLEGDPLTFLRLTEDVHRHTTKFLKKMAQTKANSRILILGGGGYNLENIRKAWLSIIEELI